MAAFSTFVFDSPVLDLNLANDNFTASPVTAMPVAVPFEAAWAANIAANKDAARKSTTFDTIAPGHAQVAITGLFHQHATSTAAVAGHVEDVAGPATAAVIVTAGRAEAASGGHLELLRWARHVPRTHMDEICSEAASGGRLEMLRFLRFQELLCSGPEGY